MSTAANFFDFSRKTLGDRPLNTQINQLIEQAKLPSENTRQYLGASAIGSECLRRIQYDWMCRPIVPVRTEDIFERGHHAEEVSRRRLIAAGFKFADPDRLVFVAADGVFRGHADGILVDGPAVSGLEYPCLWEHKCVNTKGWKAIERDGLAGLYAVHVAQVAIYQAYLNVTKPALFTVTNADTCERLHLLVPFDAALAQTTSDRAVMIVEATRAGELLDRISDDPEDWRCKTCSHRKRCWGLL